MEVVELGNACHQRRARERAKWELQVESNSHAEAAAVPSTFELEPPPQPPAPPHNVSAATRTDCRHRPAAGLTKTAKGCVSDKIPTTAKDSGRHRHDHRAEARAAAVDDFCFLSAVDIVGLDHELKRATNRMPVALPAQYANGTEDAGK